MNTMTREKLFSTAAVLSVTTGRLLCPFVQVKEAIEWVLGHYVWTHELGSKEFADRLTKLVLVQHPQLSGIDGDLTKENHEEWLAKQVIVYGDTLPLVRGSEERTESPVESMLKMVGDKPIIPIVT